MTIPQEYRDPVAFILIAAMILGGIVALHKLTAKEPPPPEVLARNATLIDWETLELVTLTSAEWLELGRRGRHYKHPVTGRYTMSLVMKCESCGELVPWVASDAEITTCPLCGNSILGQ